MLAALQRICHSSSMQTKNTTQNNHVARVAKTIGCTMDQVLAGFSRNRAQLNAMADQAKATGKRVNNYTELELRILAATVGTAPLSKERNAALKKVKWKLREASGLYAALDKVNIVLTDEKNAMVFDGRDNEQIKVKFYNAATGGNFKVEICAS